VLERREEDALAVTPPATGAERVMSGFPLSVIVADARLDVYDARRRQSRS